MKPLVPFSTTRENSRFLNYRSRMLSLKLIISFAKRFVWWSKLQNRGDGTANQITQITIPRLQAWQKFQLEIENRIFLNDNVVLQSVSTRLMVTVRHVNKKPVCHLSRISSFPHAYVSNLQKKTKRIFIEVIEGSEKHLSSSKRNWPLQTCQHSSLKSRTAFANAQNATVLVSSMML